MRWEKENGCLEYKEEWEGQDKEAGESDLAKTSMLIMMMFNCLEQDIQLTVETREDFNNNRLPTLDFEMWEEGEANGNQAVPGRIIGHGLEPEEKCTSPRDHQEAHKHQGRHAHHHQGPGPGRLDQEDEEVRVQCDTDEGDSGVRVEELHEEE